MISNLTLIATVIIPTLILLSFVYAKILTQQNKHEVVFYILATTLIFTLILWIYQKMGDPFRTRGNLGYFIDKLGLDKSTQKMFYNIYGERDDDKTCSVEGEWGGSSPTKPKYNPDKVDDSEWSKEMCKSSPDEDVDSDKYATEEELEGFTDIYYFKFIMYTLFVSYIIFYNSGDVGKMVYTLFISNTLYFGLWLLLLIMPYNSKDYSLWPEKIRWWMITLLSLVILLYSVVNHTDTKSRMFYVFIFMVINIIAFYIEEFQTHFGPEKIHKTSSLGYYIKKFGLEKATDKLKYDILIQDEDLGTDCKIRGSWSRKDEIPQITGEMDGCSLDTLGIEVGI